MNPQSTDQATGKHRMRLKLIRFVFCMGLLTATFSFNLFGQQKSIHQQELEYYKSLGKVPDSYYDVLNNYKPRKLAKVSSNCSPDKIVYGFWPFWGGSTYENLDWSLLTDFVHFSYEIDPSTGGAKNTRGWSTSKAVTTALENDVRVSICANLFANHSTFLDNSTARQNFITTIISLLKSRGGKGVCIDFEGVSTSHNSKITSFMESLSNQVHSSISGSIVTICLPAVEWSDKFDVAAMQEYVDYFVIMGYDYYWKGHTNAGSCAPLYSMTTAYNYNLNRTVTTWVNKGADPDNIILALPYYGYEWETSSSSLLASTNSEAVSRTYKTVENNASGNYSSTNRHWNSTSYSRYYVFQEDGGWKQCYIDNAYGLGKRIDLINQRNLAGMGIWALGYDDGYNDYWNQLKNKLSSCKVYPTTDTIFDSGGPEQNYCNNDDYATTVYAPLNTEEIALSFLDFDVESGVDYVSIYSGEGTDNLIGTYTGSTSPGNIKIEGNSFTIKVKNNSSVTSDGWKAIWKAVTGSNSVSAIDDFEENAGHFTTRPTYSGVTKGISSTSTLERQTTEAYNSTGALKAVLIDDNTSTDNWIVRLLSAMGNPTGNSAFSSKGTISFWMKSESAGSDATVQLWIDDEDGLEISPSISVINDGLWNQYEINLSDFNGSPYADGNGNGVLDGDYVTIDAIVLKQSDISQTWTLYIDDIIYNPEETPIVTELKIPTLLLPEDQSQIINTPVSFSWSCPTAGAEFKIQISTDLNSWSSETGFSELVFSKNVNEDKNFDWENALRQKTYYWSVQAIKDENKSMFSNPRSFTMDQTIITLDDFETGNGHFINNPTYSGSTVGISTESTLGRVATTSYGGDGSLQAVLKDNPDVATDWFVRLLSGTGVPANNTSLSNYGTLTFWMKTVSASENAKVQIQLRDSDGLESSPTISVKNDDRWHKYSFDLADFNSSSVGNGILDSPTVTLDAIILRQSQSTSDWTVFFDDVEYNLEGKGTKIIQSGEGVTKQNQEITDEAVSAVLYPNPNNGILNIDFANNENHVVEIINISGTKVLTSESKSSFSQINMHDLPNGVYFVIILSDKAKEVHRLTLNQ
jgi:hypothetical protein